MRHARLLLTSRMQMFSSCPWCGVCGVCGANFNAPALWARANQKLTARCYGAAGLTSNKPEIMVTQVVRQGQTAP